VIEKVKENTGKTITKEEIYDGSHDADVQDAVEDVIIDEMGLELAFEGTRFFDLSRVARRRNDPTYLAKRVAARSGVTDMTLYNYLSQSEKNWYLPLPEK
nr:RagB/SusD family nutrient uptake outer membrane protein [Bacteroidaceae bacterium]